MSLWIVLVFVPILLALEGFHSGSEIALLSADKLRLKAEARKGSPSARLALELAQNPERVLSTTLLMTSICVVGISALIAMYVLQAAPDHAELVAIGITSPLVVLIGELLPKALYQRYCNQLAPWVARPVLWTYRLFYPFTRLVSLYTSRLSGMTAPIEEMLTGKRRSTRDELRSLLSYGRSESEIKASERRIIRRIFDFKDAEARDAMIPLVKIEAIEATESVRDALKRFKSHRHSRMPVYADRIDNVVGVLEASDLLFAGEPGQEIRNYVSPAHYVAEAQSLENLLYDMQREDNEMVVVVDEYGGAVGIVTFEDIVEEIVGEIDDEFDQDLAPYKALSESSWLVQARMEVSRLNDELRLELPEGEYESLGGFLLEMFGRIPENRDELYLDTPRCSLRLVVRSATERQVQMVLVERLSEKRSADTA